MKHRTLLLLISICTLPSAQAMTLDEAIDAALSNENQLKVSGLNVKQAQASLQQARKRNGVNINLVSQLGYEKIESPNPSNPLFKTEGTKSPRAVELQFDYPLYTSGRKQLGIEAADMQLKARTQAYSGQKADTVLQTVQVYTDVLKQQALLNLRKQVSNNLKQSLSDAEKRFKAGVITRADLAQVRSQYAQGQADVVLAESNLDISQAQFVQVTGVDPDHLQPVKRPPAIPDSLDQVLARVENHPSIQQARFEERAAEKQYQLTKKELSPTLNATSRIGKQQDVDSFDSKSDRYMVGLQLNVPLFDQGLSRANQQKAKVDIGLANEKITTVQQRLNKQAKSTFAQLKAVRRNKQALDDAIDAATLALTYIQKELEFGTKTTFDALTAEQTLKDLQTKKVLSDQDEIVLVYQLLDQMGQLDELVSHASNTK